MHNTITETTRKSLNNNLKETYEIGKQLYWSGVRAYSAVHSSIRYLGFYLYMGDEERGVPSLKYDDEGRAKLIYELLTKTLFWSAQKAKELWCDIFNACTWRKGKPQQKIVPEVVKEEIKKDSSNSINSFNRKDSSTNTICNSEQGNQEPKPTSKEEIRAIFKGVLGDKINFDNPNGMMGTMLRSLRI